MCKVKREREHTYYVQSIRLARNSQVSKARFEWWASPQKNSYFVYKNPIDKVSKVWYNNYRKREGKPRTTNPSKER
jgi:hypothetical protein